VCPQLVPTLFDVVLTVGVSKVMACRLFAVAGLLATAAAHFNPQGGMSHEQLATGAGYKTEADYTFHHELALINPGMLRDAVHLDAVGVNVTASPKTYVSNSSISVTVSVSDLSMLGKFSSIVFDSVAAVHRNDAENDVI